MSKTGVDNQAQLEASINAAVKANMAIYPIDTRGLMADPPGGGASKAASRGSGIFNGSVYNSQRATINDSQETLSTLAAETGGKAFLDSNDITAGITQAQQAHAQLLHPRLLHDQQRREWKIPPHPGEAYQRDEREAGASARLLRPEIVGQAERPG